MVIGDRHPLRVLAKYVDLLPRDARTQAEDAPQPRDSAAAEPADDGGGATRRWALSRIPPAAGVSLSEE